MMWMIPVVLLSLILVLTGFLLVISPGTPQPFRDGSGKPLAGSLSEKIQVTINGVKQGMFIKSRNDAHPVLLYLHGGMPEYFLTRKYPTKIEDHFTVVWWEQRGSGLSFGDHIPPETMNLEQMIADTLEVTNYLRKRFRQEKIFLMGHSGGTFIGIQAAARAPELYRAYLGAAQMSDQLRSEKLAYDYMLERFRENGDKKMARALEAAPVTLAGGVPKAYRAIRDKAMHRLGVGTTHDMDSEITGVFFPSWMSRDYTLKEKINTWRGKSRSGISILWNKMISTDLSAEVTRLDIPVYFFGGVYDYTVSSLLAKDYFGKIQAPVKGFYSFEKSAHCPLFEEPEKMLKILREDVLSGTNNLADIK